MNTTRLLVSFIVVLALFSAVGFWSSYADGIQPGYFEKQEAPAYGVGGGEGFGADIGKEAEEFYKQLYSEEDE
jgi:hypothetical protein